MKKIAGLLLVLSVVSSSCAYADWGSWRHHDRYRYHDGHFWLGTAVVSGLVVGAIVEGLSHPTVVNGYYYDGNYYYQPVVGGYIVVNPPVITEQPIVVHSVPRDFISVQFRGQTYFVRNDRWFVNTQSGLVRVVDPTR